VSDVNVVHPESSPCELPLHITVALAQSVQSIAISVSTCKFVCPLTYLKNQMPKLIENFSPCYLWPVFENTYFSFFFQISKNMTLRFLK